MKRPTMPSHSRPGRPSGFTMAELLITAFVIGTAFVGATWSMSALTRTQSAYEQDVGPAMFLAHELQTMADGLPRTPSGPVGATTGAAVLALNSLSNASFSPPILADGSVAPGMEGWRQSVALSIYALDNLATPTADDPAAGLPPESSKIYRLDVSILHDDELVKTFSWWMHP